MRLPPAVNPRGGCLPRGDKATVRVALYTRVSTRGPKNGREQTPENQRKQLLAFAEAMDWRVVAEYEDRESGVKKRPAGIQGSHGGSLPARVRYGACVVLG
jgi:hypothetical protein